MISNTQKPRRSISLGGGGQSYTTEEVNNAISKTQNKTELVMYYIDYIRNYKEFTEEMLEIISSFDDNSKMTIIKEYNNVIKAVNILLR